MRQNETGPGGIAGTPGASRNLPVFREARVHNLTIAFFAMAAGFAGSGISANLYRLLVKESATSVGRAFYVGVMIFAGPNVLFESAARAWRQKSCSTVAFWLAAALCGYWSFALGLLFMQVGSAIKAL